LRGKRLLSLECIRIIACLCILIIHFNAQVCGWSQYGRFAYSNNLVPNNYWDVYLGEIGVGLFFIVSGAGLYSGYNFKKLSVDSIFLFYKKRAYALYPYYWVAYLFASFISFLWYKGMSMSKLRYIVTSILGVDGYIGMLFNRYAGFYQIGEWFLGCIIVIYLLYPFFSVLLNKYPIATLILVSVMYFSLIDKYQYHWFFFQFPYIIFGFYYMKFRETINIKLQVIMLNALILSRIMLNDCMHYYTKSIILCFTLFIVMVFLYDVIEYRYKFSRIQSVTFIINELAVLTYPAFLIHHKLFLLLAPTFNLQMFPYRYTVMLFCIYIIMVLWLSVKLKKVTDNILYRIVNKNLMLEKVEYK